MITKRGIKTHTHTYQEERERERVKAEDSIYIVDLS